MKKYIILADVACDLCKEVRDFCGMEDYMGGHINFSTGADFPTTLDWDNISCEEFYKTLSNKKVEVNTAPASPEEYFIKFKQYADNGYDILSISLSSKISSSYGVACATAEKVMAEVKGCKICCVDSLRMSGGFGLLVMYAHILKNEGKSLEEVVEWLEANKDRVHQMGPVDDLIFIARRGRISMGTAIMGSFAGVKPMSDVSRDGFVSVLCKVKGIKKALKICMHYVEKSATDIENQYILISNSNRKEYAETLKEMIETNLKPKKVFVSDVFTASGANVGPGMVGVYFLGDVVSEDMAIEKEIINKVLEEVK